MKQDPTLTVLQQRCHMWSQNRWKQQTVHVWWLSDCSLTHSHIHTLRPTQSCFVRLVCSCDIICERNSSEMIRGMFSGRGSRRRSRRYRSTCRCRAGLEPPPCSWDTGRCTRDLERATARESEENGWSRAILSPYFSRYSPHPSLVPTGVSKSWVR